MALPSPLLGEGQGVGSAELSITPNFMPYTFVAGQGNHEAATAVVPRMTLSFVTFVMGHDKVGRQLTTRCASTAISLSLFGEISDCS